MKSAILLAGLAAEGETTVREAVATRDHTERMLRARGVNVRTAAMPGGGTLHAVRGPADVARSTSGCRATCPRPPSGSSPGRSTRTPS